MKHSSKLFLMLALAFSLAACNSGLKNSTPEELGESIFIAVKNNDAEGFRSLFPQLSDLDEIMSKQGEEASDDRRKLMEKMLNDQDVSAPKDLADLRTDIEASGIDLAEATWQGVDVKEREAERDIPVVDIRMHFQQDGRSGYLTARGVGKLDRGWLLEHAPKFEAGDE